MSINNIAIIIFAFDVNPRFNRCACWFKVGKWRCSSSSRTSTTESFTLIRCKIVEYVEQLSSVTTLDFQKGWLTLKVNNNIKSNESLKYQGHWRSLSKSLYMAVCLLFKGLPGFHHFMNFFPVFADAVTPWSYYGNRVITTLLAYLLLKYINR